MTGFKAFRDSGVLPIRQFTAGGTVTAGAPVALANNGTVSNCADQATAALGWALNSGTSSDATVIDVLLGYPDVRVSMPYVGSVACVGRHVGLDLTSTVFSVNMADTTNDLFKLQAIDTTNTMCEVSLLQACFQFGASEVS